MSPASDLRLTFQQLEPDSFESLVASVWSEMGWSTEVTSSSRDRGVDVIATKSGIVPEKAVIQAKCYSNGNKVGRPEIQQYSSLKKQEPDADKVIVVTSSSFTSEALLISNEVEVNCVNGLELANAVLEHFSEDDIQTFLPDKNPNCNTDKKNVDLGTLSESEKDLANRYSKYIDRLGRDISNGKPNRTLYFHLDGDYSEDRTYHAEFSSTQGDEYLVRGPLHRVKFTSDTEKLWLRFEKTAKEYGWEIITSESIGTSAAGLRLEVPPEEADTFLITIDTSLGETYRAKRQAKISSLILKTIFDRELTGLRVSDGVSGKNVNRNSRLLK